MTRELSYLRLLETEAVFVMREVAAEFERPVLLFSGGKDSIVLLRLAEKAFRPGRFPFPILHVDTGHNFPEVIEFRDRRVRELGERLIVASVQESIDSGRAVEETGPGARATACRPPRCSTRSPPTGSTPRSAARAATRSAPARRSACSRSATTWASGTRRTSAPSCGTLYNGRVRKGEHVRVFPLSNWTELDVWRYIAAERLEVPSIYFAHARRVIERDGMLLADSRFVPRGDDEEPFEATVRYRTVGDMAVTGAVRSEAETLEAVVAEIAATRVTERGETRADDRVSAAAMEDRKREGYF